MFETAEDRFVWLQRAEARPCRQEVVMAEGNQQQQTQNPTQALGQAADRIRRVQSAMELDAPAQENMINMLRQAGDLIWAEIERRQQQQQQQGS